MMQHSLLTLTECPGVEGEKGTKGGARRKKRGERRIGSSNERIYRINEMTTSVYRSLSKERKRGQRRMKVLKTGTGWLVGR